MQTALCAQRAPASLPRYAICRKKINRIRSPIAVHLLAQLLSFALQERRLLAAFLRRLRAWRRAFAPSGMYEILLYDATLELMDPHGRRALLRKRQQVRFLQDNIIAFQDYAWGDGDIFAEYRCTPGLAVDRYRDGDRWNILISLRESKSRGDVTDFHMTRRIRHGFVRDEEWYQAEIRHATRHLRLAVIFPAARPCRQASLHARKGNHSQTLDAAGFQHLPDGRQVVTWETPHVRHLEVYTLRWRW